MEIKRDYYLNQMISRKNNGLIKVITGIRRCGKSYLLFHLFRRHLMEQGIHDDHIIALALDDFMNAVIALVQVLDLNLELFLLFYHSSDSSPS